MWGKKVGVCFKTIASFSFVVCSSLMACYSTLPICLICLFVVGMFFAMTGDVFLGIKSLRENEKKWLWLGFSSFSLQHILIISAIIGFVIMNGFSILPIIIPSFILPIGFVVANFFVSKKKLLDYDYAYVPSTIYGAVILFELMLAIFTFAFTGKFLLLALGLFMFVASDVVLSLMYFGGKKESKICFILNHVLYYLAQIFIMMSIVVY
ncbi:MAG: lysoplasmalogenase family protein [Clostridia bacterium]